MLVEPLGLQLPIGAYNGAALVMPDLAVIEQRLLPPETAREAMTALCSFAVEIWAFAGDRWLVENPDGVYVEQEERTMPVRPTIAEYRAAAATV